MSVAITVEWISLPVAGVCCPSGEALIKASSSAKTGEERRLATTRYGVGSFVCEFIRGCHPQVGSIPCYESWDAFGIRRLRAWDTIDQRLPGGMERAERLSLGQPSKLRMCRSSVQSMKAGREGQAKTMRLVNYGSLMRYLARRAEDRATTAEARFA